MDRLRSAAVSSATSRSTTSRSAPPTSRSSAWTRSRRYDFAKAKYIVSFGADFLETWLALDRESARLRRVARLLDGQMSAKFVYVGPADGSDGPQRGRVARHPARHRDGAGARDGVGGRGRAGRRRPARRRRSPPTRRRRRPRRPAFPPRRIERDRAGVRRGPAEPRGRRRQSARSTPAPPSSARRSTSSITSPATSADGALRRRPRRRATATPRSPSWRRRWTAGEIGCAARPRRQSGLRPAQGRGFADKLKKVPFKVSTSMYLDETASLCDLLLPQHHALERWDDLRARARACTD